MSRRIMTRREACLEKDNAALSGLLDEARAKLQLSETIAGEAQERFKALVNALRVLDKDILGQNMFTARLSNVATDVRDRMGAGGASVTWKRASNLLADVLRKHAPPEEGTASTPKA